MVNRDDYHGLEFHCWCDWDRGMESRSLNPHLDSHDHNAIINLHGINRFSNLHFSVFPFKLRSQRRSFLRSQGGHRRWRRSGCNWCDRAHSRHFPPSSTKREISRQPNTSKRPSSTWPTTISPRPIRPASIQSICCRPATVRNILIRPAFVYRLFGWTACSN